jgi:hypothetical protein
LKYQLCHRPKGFKSQGKESVYSLDMICTGEGIALDETNFKLRVESHVLKDEVTGEEYDFSLRNLTSIRTTLTEPTPGFLSPLHLRAPFNRELTDFNVHVKQDPETGDFLPLPRQRSLAPRDSHPLILSISNLDFMTNKLRSFHLRYRSIIIDNVLAFPVKNVIKTLPPCEGMAPKISLYSQIWFTVKGEGSLYCHNKLGTHKSSTIRFHLDCRGNIYQGCWCMNTHGRGVCSEQTTQGMAGFQDKMNCNPLLADIFTTRLG